MRFTLFLVSALTVVLSASEIDDIMNKAGQYYRDNNYTAAISEYEKLLSEGYEGASLYYNLGNAYYRMGKLGYAILYYEKAYRISPNDEDIRHNLALANSRTIDKIDALPEFFIFEWWESFLALFTLKTWILLSIIFYFLMLFALAGYFLVGHIIPQRITFFSGTAVIIFLLITISVVAIKLNREEKRLEAVIVENSVVVKLAPNEKGKVGFIVHEGLKILIEDEIDNWNRVRLADGKVGWVDKTQLRII